jgi:hypothetical protein
VRSTAPQNAEKPPTSTRQTPPAHVALRKPHRASEFPRGDVEHLRLHGFIERLPNRFRYRVTEFGFRAALFLTRVYSRLLRPGLAAVLPALGATDTPLKAAFDKIDARVNEWVKQAQLAA